MSDTSPSSERTGRDNSKSRVYETLDQWLSITRYQGLLKTERDEAERQKIQKLLREEELWMKRYTLKEN
jgi:hypothetical protein